MNREERRLHEIKNGKRCPYCNDPTDLIDSAEIYGKSYGMIYICRPCHAYVGVHSGTTRALGRIADQNLRELKKRAHQYFDPIWRDKLINDIWPEYVPDTSNREKAYIWLTGKMGLAREDCHIGMFDEDQCLKAIEICKKELLTDN